jgi:hypothetical protein
MNIFAPHTVLVTAKDLQAMRRVWPCSGLPFDGQCVSFQFDSNGLCDVSWYTDEGIDIAEPEGIDGGCMVALCEDAEQFLKQYRALPLISFQAFGLRLPALAARVPVWVCKLLVISGVVPLLYWIVCKLDERYGES